MSELKIAVKNIPDLGANPRRSQQPIVVKNNPVTGSFAQIMDEMAAGEQVVAAPNPQANGVFAQLGISTDAWLLIRAGTGD